MMRVDTLIQEGNRTYFSSYASTAPKVRKSHFSMRISKGQSRERKDHGPENLALLRRMALSLIKAEESKGSIRSKRQVAGWNNDFLEKILLDFTDN